MAIGSYPRPLRHAARSLRPGTSRLRFGACGSGQPCVPSRLDLGGTIAVCPAPQDVAARYAPVAGVFCPRRARPSVDPRGARRFTSSKDSMSLQCGIVGLPNVGKSTLFNALTKAGIAAENYPFCTIEPNVGIVEVPDPRLAALAAIAHPERVVPAAVEFVDIAGLVAGASKGEGLGNKFLANIRETDAIAHVVRCFEDPNVIHVANKIDPLDDIEVINTELALADLAAVDKQLVKYVKVAKAGGDKEAQRIVAALEKVGAALNEARPARSVDLYPEERAVLKPLFLLTMKPTLYVANVSEHGFTDNPLLAAVEQYAQRERAPVVAIME